MIDKPWISLELKKEIRKRDRLGQIFLRLKILSTEHCLRILPLLIHYPLFVHMNMILIYRFEDQEKVQLLSDYFCSIASLDNDNKDIPYMTDRGHGILTKINVTEQDINDIISCLDPQKASEPVDISHRMLIATKNTICGPLCKLFDLI